MNDSPSLWETEICVPEKIMFQLLGGRLFETENLTPLRIAPGHHVGDGAVFPCGVHPLKNRQYRILVGGVVKLLQGTQFFNVIFQGSSVCLLGFAERRHGRRPFSEFDLSTGFTWKSFPLIFVFAVSVCSPYIPKLLPFDNASKPAITSKSSSSIPA
jgi:hypothetical protein